MKNIDAATLAMTGGKAANLTALSKAGFQVPKGFVITTDAYREFISFNNLEQIANKYLVDFNHEDTEQLRNAANRMREEIEKASLPDHLISKVKLAYSELGEGSVAIRSSATAEDLPDASFAGQYDTSLNIEGIDNVLHHIKRCFASMWTTRAIAYREENHIPHEHVRLAVVVQSMIQPKCAGVMFTRNPFSESTSEIIIESNFGLGESVVSGYSIPDRYVVNCIAPENYSLVSREIGTKDTIIERDHSGKGTQQIKISQEQSQKSSLEDDEVLELAKIGSSIERFFKSPQDVEWAIDSKGDIHILQARPITVRYEKTSNQKDDVFWTRGYADDYWNDPVTPLYFNLLGDQLIHIVNVEANAIMGYKDMPEELLKLHKGHAYFNLDVLRRKVVNEMPPFIRSDDVMNYFPEGAGPFGKDTMRKLPFALKTRIMAEIRVMLLDGDGSMTKTNDVYEKWTKEVFIPECMKFDEAFNRLESGSTAQDYLAIADDLDITMMKHFRMVRYGLPVHTLGMNLITNYLLRRWLGEKAATAMYPILLSGLEHKTSETNKRIEELASIIRQDKNLEEKILGLKSKEILDSLKRSNSINERTFIEKFNTFLDDFGDRGFTRETYYPRWRESPEYVFDILKSLVSEQGKNLIQNEEALAKRRKKAEQLVEEVIRKQRFGPIKWMLFSTILGMARTYVGFRENQRFNLDRWITRERKAYLEIGKQLIHQGYLQEPSHIFFLYRNEIRAIVREKNSLSKDETKSFVEERKEEFLKYENITPPKFMYGNREFDDPMPDSVEGYSGMPASQGLITGTVRVLNSVEEVSQVRAGEILVVPRTDPGWTPVFSKIGGLVTETGGLLSHGAVVSREFGIPAVTNIRNACMIFKTGQKITLDGNLGKIVLHETE
ncbi:MAG: hypothetical protein JW779_02615 [Candidatus Thorarchaeota archaeon]|nr:hypothetical protein [Candidatus Thorarchaeota archaeon]